MKRFIFLFILMIFLFISILGIQSVTAKTLHDDFSGDYFDSNKWKNQEFVREIANGELVLKIRNSINNEHAFGHTLFKNPDTINTIQYDISVKEANLDSGTDTLSFVRIQGLFYNTKISGGATGDVAAILYLGNRGSGLEAWWEVHEADDDERSSYTEKGSGTLDVPGLDFGISYTTKMEYDGDKNFTFTVGAASASFTAGPAKVRDVVTQHKGFRIGAYTTDGSGNGYASATIDNVLTNGIAYDDFLTSPLDQTKWEQLEFVREINDGKLRLAAHGTDSTESTRINLSVASAYTEATITIKDESVISSGARGRTRISGEFYNDTYGPGSYNGYEGDVYAQVYINYYDDGTLQAKCYAERANDADWNTAQELMTHDFNLPIALERPYTLSIRFTGTKFFFTIKDTVTGREEFYVYEVETDVNKVSDPNVQIISRAYGNGSSGYMVVEVDDIYVDIAAPTAAYDATGEWSLTDSNPWSDGGCDLPSVGDTTNVTITQNGNDFTIVDHDDEGDNTFTGSVFGNSYFSTRIEEENGETETLYIIFNLSQNTSGAGSVTAYVTDGIDECNLGFAFVITRQTDDNGGGGGGGGGGGCFIKMLSR